MGTELTYYQIHSIHSREKLHSETSRCHTRTEALRSAVVRIRQAQH